MDYYLFSVHYVRTEKMTGLSVDGPFDMVEKGIQDAMTETEKRIPLITIPNTEK